MRIVVLGANGQVAAEVCQKLVAVPGIELVPVSRTRNGSAWLRSKGIAVWHGDVSSPAQAAAMLAGTDVVANFALAGGVPSQARRANEAIISASIAAAPGHARIIFFSTLATRGVWNSEGKRSRNAYGDLKRRNERYFERHAREASKSGWILRLGHVCGDEQGITGFIRQEIENGPVYLADPERFSNTTYVEAIAEAILAIGEDRASPPGRFDLVNTPQWRWREVYEREARKLGMPAVLKTLCPGLPRGTGLPEYAFALVRRLGVRPLLERMAAYLPGDYAERAKVLYSVNRARDEIAAMSPGPEVRNSAAFWPALDIMPLEGVRDTRALMDGGAFLSARALSAWPADLQSSDHW